MIKSLSHQAIGSILCEINDILALYQGREGGSGGRKGTCSHFLGIYLPSKFQEILKIYFLLYSIASHKKFASTHPGLYLSLVYGLCCNVVIVFKCTTGLKTYSKNKLIVMKSFSRSFSIEIDTYVQTSLNYDKRMKSKVYSPNMKRAERRQIEKCRISGLEILF